MNFQRRRFPQVAVINIIKIEIVDIQHIFPVAQATIDHIVRMIAQQAEVDSFFFYPSFFFRWTVGRDRSVGEQEQ